MFDRFADGLTVRRVETLEQAQSMRRIRNQCRSYMTRNRQWISRKEQADWWQSLDPAVVRCWLYGEGSGGKWSPVGYGLLRIEGELDWLSGGLLPEARGRGLGKLLFQHLLDHCEGNPWLELLVDNVRARRLYEFLGFVPLEVQEGVLTMRYRECVDAEA